MEARGNFRDGENPAYGKATRGASLPMRFRDVWGELHWFAQTDVEGPLGAHPVAEPLVPRELIVGRALAVFWPIQPFDGLWRLGWLH